ncbi:Glutamyl-tRNA reductase [Porphyromonas crevioricanis]|uniref:Glutamyl-tRNA reductase n=1 Tax=Porphyromonas crevioricanis TaxID=393921 RepID=A0A2X4PKC5_9PORP|nr:glutamyl-tRNA reductase [Porphyromonas crevioricanis]GAD06497.1 glutamyl-tRNA reductase [Porphyromonas crevioricanis JCM 13913]SQH72745.1 Glutamyl-tRNA reductase [Porphyromonas crevioricanis]
MIGLIGINHNTAPVEVRQQFALSPAEASAFVDGLVQMGQILGAIVLSTCNRIEVYFEHEGSDPAIAEKISERLRTFKKIDYPTTQYVYSHRGEEVTLHLFRLAAGLESMVVGETQILGQLKDAFRQANDNSQSTSMLSRLFHKAFETAKIIRTEFIVSSTPISAGSAAVEMMDGLQGVERDMPVLILGAGQMAETILSALRAKGYSQVKMYNRTRERAAKMAALHGISYYCEGELHKALAASRLIFVTTSALTPIVTRNEMSARDRDVFLFDMSVPRNIEPEVSDLPFAHVYTIDDLKRENLGQDVQALDHIAIERCISEKTKEFSFWVEASQLRGIIGRIQSVSKMLLEKELNNLPSAIPAEQKSLIEEHDEHFRITLSTAVIAALKEITSDGRNMKHADAINALCRAIEKREA